MAVHAIRFEVKIEWITATETDNAGFTIERRLMNNNLWTIAGWVSGKGTTTSPQRYEYRDRVEKGGRYAYRIIQVDRNGHKTYVSNAEIEVGVVPAEFSLSDAYPNPFNPGTTVEFSVGEAIQAGLTLHDITGRIVAVPFDEPVTPGRIVKARIDASNLSSGTYILHLKAGDQSLRKMITLIK
jgi:hypothetical protein